LPDFSLHNIPKRGKDTILPINYQRALNIQSAVLYVFQMAIKYTNLYQFRALRNLPKLGYLVWKYTIWQPCVVGDGDIDADYDDETGGLIFNNMSTPPTAKRCYSTSGEISFWGLFTQTMILCCYMSHGVVRHVTT
jgi:hypothetical protein